MKGSLTTSSRYLLADQYRTDENLAARASLHALYGTSGTSWFAWVFDRLDLPPEAQLLELGCGPAYLWAANHQRLPDGWRITLSDFSAGMLHSARARLAAVDRPFAYELIDAAAIPYGDASFDAVVANHMLYHVADRQRALREIRRVLRPGGRLFAATVGRHHMRELRELSASVVGEANALPASKVFGADAAEQFGLENGADQLQAFFEDVTCLRFEDSLEVTREDDLVAYILSGHSGRALTHDEIARLRDTVSEHIAGRGSFHVTKATGLFRAVKPA